MVDTPGIEEIAGDLAAVVEIGELEGLLSALASLGDAWNIERGEGSFVQQKRLERDDCRRLSWGFCRLRRGPLWLCAGQGERHENYSGGDRCHPMMREPCAVS
jgi:hypothetical protein